MEIIPVCLNQSAQVGENFDKRGSLDIVSGPASEHSVVETGRAVEGLGQICLSSRRQAKVAQVLDDDRVAQMGERLLLGKRQNFPQRHAECPNVRFARKFAL